MAFTQADLDKLDIAIKSGTRSVNYGDTSVTYHSLDEMMRLRAAMQADIASAAGTPKTKSSLAQFNKG